MRQQFPMQTKRLGNAVYRCSRDGWQQIITLAYTGSSAGADAGSSRAPTPLAAFTTSTAKTCRRSRVDLLARRPKTSVAVRTRAASRADASRCARLQLQRCAGKSTARRRGIHLSTV